MTDSGRHAVPACVCYCRIERTLLSGQLTGIPGYEIAGRTRTQRVMSRIKVDNRRVAPKSAVVGFRTIVRVLDPDRDVECFVTRVERVAYGCIETVRLRTGPVTIADWHPFSSRRPVTEVAIDHRRLNRRCIADSAIACVGRTECSQRDYSDRPTGVTSRHRYSLLMSGGREVLREYGPMTKPVARKSRAARQRPGSPGIPRGSEFSLNALRSTA